MERYLCVHGHFYQPPRENPWLEDVELQDSAYPFHDWNERITHECYAVNGASRILDGDGKIAQIVNNYARMSFNIGPTLLQWMERSTPSTYFAILAADKESQARFGGHGSAMAQAYNHMIMPLANSRDKRTQVVWGIRDFEVRFGRRPEGMWLPETAVDLETLDLLAEHGVKFAILEPHQAARTRPLGSRQWHDVDGRTIDPTRPYVQPLRSGRSIALFFYDGPISRAVAFERLLNSGEGFAQRLMDGFDNRRTWPQLMHIATDGESYGHHHRFGDMALAYALHHIETNELVRLTNYGQYLELHPPTQEVQIRENTSWSCAHGVERWRSNCGCNTGGHPGWNQEWRAPLREALDWLRDAVAPLYERHGSQLLVDPWVARDAYIDVILDRSAESVARFVEVHAGRPLSAQEVTRALKLLELQRHAMLMYTSCGWFFDELYGIETVQVIQYAGRAIQLAQELFGDNIEDEFLSRLEKARSNIPEHGNGRVIYDKFVRPAVIGWNHIAAHFAIDSIFEAYAEESRIHCYSVTIEDYNRIESGRSRLVVGKATFTSDITTESATRTFGVLHLGDHNINGGVRDFRGEEAYQQVVQEMQEAYTRADFSEVIRLMDMHFGQATYSLWNLFRDEQRRVLDQILQSSLEGAESVYRLIYENEAPMMRFLKGLQIPAPRAFTMAAEFFLGTALRRAMADDALRVRDIQSLLAEVTTLGISLDHEGLGYTYGQTLHRAMQRMVQDPMNGELLASIEAAAALVEAMPFGVDLWSPQNAFYELLQSVYPAMKERALHEDEAAGAWVAHFTALGGHLKIRVPE